MIGRTSYSSARRALSRYGVVALLAFLLAAVLVTPALAAPNLTRTPVGPLAVTEGGAETSYTISIEDAPVGNDLVITLNPFGANQCGLSTTSGGPYADPINITFPMVNGPNQSITVYVIAVDDFVAETTPHPCAITPSKVANGNSNYTTISAAGIGINITDNDVAGIVVLDSPMILAEGSTTDTFRVQLSSQPTANVSIAISASDSQTSSSPTPLTFTSVNWNVPQTVTVTAVDDPVVEGNHTGVVNLTSSSSDLNYSGKTASASANITDNDTATITFFDAEYPLRDENEPVGVVLTTFARINYSAGASSLATALTLPIQTTGSSGNPATFNVDYSQTTTSVTFPPTSANNDVQQIDFSVIDDLVTEPTEQFTFSFGTPTASIANMLAQITSSDTLPVNIIDDDAANISITIDSGGPVMPLDEDQTLSDAYLLQINTQPNATVEVIFEDVNDQCEFSLDFGGTFNSGPQSAFLANAFDQVFVIVRAVDDLVVEADPHPCTITHILNTTASGYDTYVVPSVTGSIIENDLPGLDIIGQPDTITEAAGPSQSDTFQVRLLSQPTANVTVNFTSSDGQTTVTSSLTFTSVNWNTYQNVTVTAVDDSIVETTPHVGNISITTTSADANYNGLTASASANINDNDVATVTVTGSPLSVSEAVSTGVSYTLNLGVASGITATTNITADADCRISTTSSTGPWSTTLTGVTLSGSTNTTVFVRAYNDKIVEGAHTCTITHTNTVSATSGANNRPIANVTGNVTDNDSATYFFTAATSTIGEATTSTSPSITFTITANGEDGGESNSLESAIVIPFAITGGSASGGQDCICATVNAQVSTAGIVTTVATLSGLIDDRVLEGNETFNVEIGNETGGTAGQQAAITLGSPFQHVITVTDNETAYYGLTNNPHTGLTTSSGSEATSPGLINGFIQINYIGSGTIDIASAFSVGYTIGGGSTATGGGVDYSIGSSFNLTPGLTYNDIGGGVAQAVVNIPITVINDSIAENDETIIINANANETGTSGSYAALITETPLVIYRTHTYTILDNDTAGGGSGTGSGGGNGTGGNPYIVNEQGATCNTFTYTLTSQPTANVLVTFSVGTQTNISVNGSAASSSGTFTFNASNWNTGTSVVVCAINDTTFEGGTGTFHPGNITVDFDNGSADSFYAALPNQTLFVDVEDNDAQPTINVSTPSVSVTENGSTATFTVTLSQDPGGSVTVNVGGSNADFSVDNTSLSFNSGNWSGGILVTVTATDDFLLEQAIENYLISLTATGHTGNSVNVAVNDNETATVAFSSSTLTVGEASGTTTRNVILTINGTGNVGGPTFTIGTGVTVSGVVTATSGTANIPADASMTDALFSFSSGSASGAIDTVSFTVVNDTIDELDEDFTLGFGTISGATASGITSTTVTIADDDVAGINVTGVDTSIIFNEGNQSITDSFNIQLNSTPTANVQIVITAGPDCEVSINSSPFGTPGTINTNDPLAVFNVVARPFNDLILEGDHTCALTYKVDSTDNAYDDDVTPAIRPATQTYNVLDNEVARYFVTNASINSNTGSGSEAVTTVSYVVGVYLGTTGTGPYGIEQPFSVTTTIGGTATAGGTDHNATSVTSTFTSASLFGAAGGFAYIDVAGFTYTFNVNNDLLAEASETVTFTLPANESGTSGSYDTAIIPSTLPFANTLFTYTILDNDAPVLTQSASTVNVTESGTTATYTLTLSNADTGVTAQTTITAGEDCEVSINGTDFFSSLVATLSNSATTITVRAIDDRIVEGTTHPCTISHSNTSGSSVSVWNGVTIGNVTANVTDNDTATFQFVSATGSGSEATPAGIGTVEVVFNTTGIGLPSTATLEAAITVSYTVAGVTATGGGVDFALANGSVVIPTSGASQNITITVFDDLIDESDETLTITLNGTETGGTAAQQAAVTLGGNNVFTYTILDNDTAGVSFTGVDTGTTLNEGSSTGDTYSVQITSTPPTGDAIIIIDPDNDCEISIEGGPFGALGTITTNSTAPFSIEIRPVNDRIVEGSLHTCTVTYDFSTSTSSQYSGITRSPDTYNINDNDTATYQFAVSTDSVTEGTGVGTTTVNASVTTTFNTSGGSIPAVGPNALETAIQVPFTVNGASTATGGGTDYTITASPITIPTSGATQNIVINVTRDSITETNETVVLDLGIETGGSSGQQAAVTQGGVTNYTLTINDDDQPGINLTGVGLTSTDNSGGPLGPIDEDLTTTDAYTIALNSTPGALVTIGITTGADCYFNINGGGFGNSGTINTNSTTPFTIVLRAVNDRIVEGAHTCTVNYTVGSADPNYDQGSNPSIVPAPYTYNIVDNDSATYQFVLGSSSIPESSTPAVLSVSTTFTTSGEAGFTTPTFESAFITVPFTITGTATGGGTDYSMASSVTIPNTGTTQNVFVTIVNDIIDELDETVIVTLGNESTGSPEQQAVVTIGSPSVHTLTILDDDSTPGINVTGVNTSIVFDEANTAITDSFDIQLNSTPTDNVQIVLTAGPDCEVSVSAVNPTIAPTPFGSSITMTTNNPLTVFTVVARPYNDNILEANHTCALTYKVDSTDNNYDDDVTPAIRPATQTYNILDNEVGDYGMVYLPTPLAFTSSSSGSEATTPANTVSVFFAINGTGSGPYGFDNAFTVGYSVTGGTATNGGVDYNLPVGSVTFNPGATFFSNVTSILVPFPVVNDNIDELNETIIITADANETGTSGSYDTAIFRTASVPFQSHTYTILDNDTAGVNVNVGGGVTATEGGSGGSFTVVLTSQPTSDVTITYTITDGQTTTVTSITFTSLNWNIPQVVNVTAVNDGLAEGTHTGVISWTSSSGDSNYNGTFSSTVNVTITDNDPAVVTITGGGSVNVVEGGATSSYQLNMNAQTGVTATTTVSGGANCLVSLDGITYTATVNATLSGSALTTIYVQAIDDTVLEGAHTCTLTHTNLVSGSSVFNGVAISNVTGNVTDNESATITYTAGGSATEGGSGSATATLIITANGVPNTGTLGANVTVAINNTAGTASVADYNVTTSSITFTSGSSSGATQSISYTGTDDQTVEGSESFGLSFGAVTTTISTGVTASGSTTATINDNDTATITYTAGPDVTEGSSNSGTVTLTINATGTGTVQLGYDVTVAITNTNGTAGSGDYGVTTSSVTFVAGSGTGTNQGVTYTGTNDAFAEGTETFTLGFGTVTSTASSQITASGTQSVNVIDTDTATVTNVGGNSVTLSEATDTTHDSYTLAINPQPGVSATTVVTAGADCLVSLSAGSGYATSITATLTDSTPTTIYVRPYDDRIVEGDGQLCVITHGNLVSASPVFNGLAVANVTATVDDDDFGAYGFEFPWATSHIESAGTFPIGAYITFLTDGVGTNADSRLEVPMVVPVTYTGTATGSGTDYTGFATITFPITTADSMGQLWVDSNFTIINDNLIEGSENAILTMGTGTSTPAQQANLYLDAGVADVRTVTITDNDTATITYTAGPDVTEGSSNSGTATLTLTTNGTGPAQLASNITVIITNTAGTASIGDYSVITSSVTFIGGSGTGATQSVTYTGTNDAFAEGTETFTLGFGTVSGTGAAQVTASGTQSVNVLDTDTPTLTNGAGVINLSEATATTSGSYTLTINAQPGTSYTTLVSADVDTLVSIDNVNFFPSITATLTNSTATTIYVRPVDDRSVEGNHTGTITHGPLVLVSGSNVFVGQTFSNTTVNITDNDTASIAFTTASSTVAEGSSSTGLTATLTINANGTTGTPELGAAVTVALNATDGTAISADYSLITSSITFASGAGNGATQSFTYSGTNDLYAEPSPENFTIGFGAITTTISSGVSASGTHTGNITDTDTATITVTDASGSTDISEAVSTPDSYTIQLNAQPSDNYMTTITAGADCEISLNVGGPYSGSVMATISGSTATTIYVRAVNDNIIEGNHTCVIDNGTLVGGSPFNGLSIPDVTANVADNDSATVSFSALSNTIAEPNSGSVNAVLTYVTNGTGPASLDTTITVAVTNSVGTALVTDYTVSTTSVSFTAGALNGATQAINYSATNDSYAEDAETFNVNFGAVTGPATADLQTHVVTITDAGDAVSITVAPNDDDVAPVGNELQVSETGTTVDSYVITLNIEPGYTATTNISAGVDCLLSLNVGGPFTASLTGVTLGGSTIIYVQAVDDAYAETTPHPCVITHSNLTSSVARFNGQSVSSITADVMDNDVPTVIAVADDDDVAPAGNEIRVSEVNLTLTDTYTITMNAVPGLTATTVVTADVNCLVSLNAGGPFTSSVTATLVGSTPTVIYVRAANDEYDEPTLHSCGINHGNTSSATAPFNNVPVNPVVGEVEDNDTFGVNIVQTGGTTDVGEGGPNDTYSFQLTSVPFVMVSGSPVNYPQTSQVNVLLSTTAQCQISTDGITFAQSLLRSLNTTGVVTVTVRAVDDLVIEGPHSCPITHVVSSPDPAYNTLIVPDVNVSITDNDGAGVVITPLSVSVVEGGATSTYSVVLASQPAADVIINIGGTGVQANASSTTLTFTPSNYNVAQVVTVTAIDDNVAEGAHSATFTHTLITTDPNYNALGALPSVNVNITDNDTVGVVVTQTNGNTVVQEGSATDTYSVVLTSQPTSNVTITIGGLAGQVTLGSTTLTFTPANWNIAQTVTVTAFNDSVDEDEQVTITLTHTATSADSNYNGISIVDVPVLVVDNDVAAVIVTPNAVSVTEGGATGSYSVVLATEPTANVTVTVVDTAQATASPVTLTFTSANWNVPQNVTVTAVNDTVSEGAHVTIFTHSASSSDVKYSGISVGSVQVNITDNDSTGLTVVQSGGNTAVSETGPTTDTYTIGLNSTPSSAVSITVTADPQCTVSSDGITFGSSATISLSGITPQTITVRAVDDSIVEVTPHPCVLVHSVTSADPNYNGLPISNITVQVTDNDVALPPVDAVNDTASTSVGSAVSVAVLGNDTYTGSVTITIESAPANGTAIPSGMTINYTHTGVGPTVDTFTYRITDSNGTFDIATVTVNVAGPTSQVTNGGFESGSPVPTGFTIVNRNNSGVVCSATVARTGNCALVIYGARTPTIAKQTLANPAPGQSVTVETWAKWASASAGGYVQVRVFFTDGTTQIIGITVPNTPATQPVYQFLTVTGTVQTGKTVLKTELWIGYAATSGSVTYDDVAVNYGIVPPSLPAVTREGALPAGVLGLPTPSAPDGFRGNN